MRSAIAVVVFLCLISGTAAGDTYLEFSGQDFIWLVDGDNDGPDADDCRYRIRLGSTNIFTNPTITLEAIAGDGPGLQLCADLTFGGTTLAGSDESSDFVESMFTDGGVTATAPPQEPAGGILINPPIEVEIIAEAFGPPDGLPLEVNQVSIEEIEGPDLYLIDICKAGSTPAFQIDAFMGLGYRVPLVPYPSAENPTYLMLEDLPFERTSPNLGEFLTLDSYIPIASGAFRANFVGEDGLQINIVLEQLRPCGAAINSAPVITSAALFALVVILSGFGVWRLRRSVL